MVQLGRNRFVGNVMAPRSRVSEAISRSEPCFGSDWRTKIVRSGPLLIGPSKICFRHVPSRMKAVKIRFHSLNVDALWRLRAPP